jgi:hypothetical protein
MPGCGYGYGEALVVRLEVVRLFLLVLLEKLKPCSPATCLSYASPILILIPISLSLSMPARMLLLSLTAIATVAISRVFGLEMECAVALYSTVWPPGAQPRLFTVVLSIVQHLQ